jgi:hypothetical protein
MGVANSFGVVGRSLVGVVVEEQNILVSGVGVAGLCDRGVGVHGVSTSGWGIIGESNGRAGVTGKSITGVGVEARSEQSHGLQAAAQNGVGVLGDSVSNNGVMGRSGGGIGVEGESQQGLAGVRGRSAGLFGVIGESGQGVGVAGVSQTNAIQGWSTGTGGASIGVAGWSQGGAGVQGSSNTGIGVSGSSPGGWAGYFEGNVLVRGNFYVTNGSKSAAVKHRDGTQRALYCLESPESYFEDFGEAELTGESLVVKLERDFAALVKRNQYQVFLTSYGPEALYVRKRGAAGFEIARVNGGAGGKQRAIGVGYRIVARRADLKPERLPKLTLPGRTAALTRPDPVAVRTRRVRVSPPARLDPLPARPRTPSLDLKSLAKAKPVRDRKNGEARE